MITATLREETKKSHADLDQSLYPYIQQTKTPEQYSKLLSVFYGFINPIQQQFDQYFSEANFPGYTQRRKPSWIISDLTALNAASAHIPECNYTGYISNLPEAWGAFYVIEGSSMGGTIISKTILKNIPGAADALQFFTGYGEHNPAMWKNFLDLLETSNDNEADGVAIIESAKNTFTNFKKWIDEQYGSDK